MLSEHPSFNAARRYERALAVVGTVLAIFGTALLLFTLARGTLPGLPGIPTPRALGFLGAALWTAAAGFLSSAILSFARQRLLDAEIGGHAHAPAPAPEQTDTAQAETAAATADTRRSWRSVASSLAARSMTWLRDGESLARWPPPMIATLGAVVAWAGTVALWRLPPEPAVDPLAAKIAAAALIAAAFPLLVLERFYATAAAELLPEAPQLNRLLRVPLTACLVLAIARILMSVGFGWAALIERATGLLIAFVSLEVVLRCAAIIFIPFAPLERRQSLADSRLAGALLRLGLPNIRNLNVAVRQQLGIDLSRSWALAFIQRAMLPVLVGIGLFAWGITGVTALSINQRGIYERFGAPVAVFGPGVHVHLPWPLGQIRPVEIGVVHLLPIEFLLPGGGNADKSSSVGGDENEPLVAAEAPAPESADRLWTDDHPYEGSYIIASQEHGEQGFQLVDIDMAVIYRVGLSDEAARNAAYRVTDIDELIQALSGQILVRYFTSNTLLDLLGKSRETFTRQFQTALQQQLDRFSTGVEAIGISVEAIHPPPGAATAYHDVQAAEIRANTRISVRRGEASRSIKTSQQAAVKDRDGAAATAAELVGLAQGQSVVFAGDRQAYAQDGYPFLLERWLDNLTNGLARSGFVLIDHRLNGQNIPAVDLRDLRGPAANESFPAANPQTPEATAPSAEEEQVE
jgi:regulator of protease activity HflC (stomatin/prohibitin superfamily)